MYGKLILFSDHREILLNTNISPTFPLLYGREHDLEEIYNRLEGEDRLVLITGAVGVGKSALALAAGHQMAKQINCVTIGINGHGCNQTVHLAARLSRVIGLRYQTNQPELLCNWLASHSERIVFLFDNIDLPEREDSRLSSFMDMILQSADNVTFLCSSRRNFYYGGDFAATEFHLADQQEAAGEIFNNFLPALPAEAFSRLMRICNCNPLALKLVASALATGTVNQETLERGLDAIESNNSGSVYVDMDPSKLGESENDHKEAHILAFVAKVVASHLPTQTRQLLAVSSLFDAPVDAALLQRIMNHIGLICTDVDIENSSFFQWDCTGTRVYIPDILKYVIRMGVFNIQELSNSFYSVMLSMISDICKDYHTKDPTQALNHFWLHYDTFYGAISTAIRSIDIATLASTLTYPTMCVYLHQTLESADYQLIFSLLKDVVEESVNDSTKGAVLSCLAYNNLDEGEYTEARGHSEAACNLQKGNDDRSGQVYLAFSLLCLGRACWKQGAHDQDTGLAMVKKSMDMFKKAIDLHCSMSMYAYEVYASMHRERGSLMRARHYYNVIDFALGSVTEQMPFMQQGYNNRRSIWERMGLYAWAADAARKAAILADNVYSEHPLTADMFIKLCDCLMKTGDTRDALAAALNALRIRQRVLGRHLDTALAHKAAAYLLLRIGYFQEAVDHGIIALEICREVGAHERYSIDTETIIAQGQYRLRLASSFFVKLDTHEQPILRAQQASAAVTAISSAHASEVDFNLSGSSTQV